MTDITAIKPDKNGLFALTKGKNVWQKNFI